MIQYKKGICTCHGEERLIVKKISDRKYCHQGNQARLRARKKETTKEPKGELALFHEIWNSRPHVCAISGKRINENDLKDFQRWISCFSHVLPKGSYPKYRLNPENIVLKTPKMHHAYHTKGKSELLESEYGEQWKAFFELKAKLAAKYHRS